MKKNFSVIGGDQRNIMLAELIKADGHTVYTYGFENARLAENIDKSNDLFSAIGKSDYIVGPIPFTSDMKTVNAPFHAGEISVNKLISAMTPGKILIAGRIDESIYHLAAAGDVITIDLLTREDMSVLNAVPTAEGAIQIAMEETRITLNGSTCYVLGFGRIGKILSNMLKGLGASVTCVARKNTDLAWIKAYGYNALHLSKLEEQIGEAQVVFNTVPHMIVDKKILTKIRPDTLIVDLASKPGGIDFASADEIGIRAIHALSLPGRVAPVTAAKYIKDIVYNIIDEMEGG
jgi:dipicolinate synthase subunit A